jgi:hypothetical protein
MYLTLANNIHNYVSLSWSAGFPDIALRTVATSEVCPLFAVAVTCPLISLEGADICPPPCLKMLIYLIVKLFATNIHRLCIVKIASLNKWTRMFPLAYKNAIHEMTSDKWQVNTAKKRQTSAGGGDNCPWANILESASSDTKYYQHNYSFFNIPSITDLFNLLLTNRTFSFFDY